jgi:hypothetical protein
MQQMAGLIVIALPMGDRFFVETEKHQWQFTKINIGDACKYPSRVAYTQAVARQERARLNRVSCPFFGCKSLS